MAAHESFSRIRGWRSVLSSANIDLSDRDLASVFEIKYAVLLMSFAVAALSCLLRKANEILTVIMAKK